MGIIALLRPLKKRDCTPGHKDHIQRHLWGQEAGRRRNGGALAAFVPDRQVGKGHVVYLETLGAIGSSLVDDGTEPGLVWELKMVASSQRSPLLSRN